MANGESEYSLGEARRQIDTLWEKYAEIREDTSDNMKELARIHSQNEYMVKLLERIDASNQLALPRCAERGLKIEDLQDCRAKTQLRIDNLEPRIEQLEATQRTLRWVAGVISALVTALAIKVLKL